MLFKSKIMSDAEKTVDNQISLSNSITVWKASFFCVCSTVGGRDRTRLCTPLRSANIIFYCTLHVVFSSDKISTLFFIRDSIRLCSSPSCRFTTKKKCNDTTATLLHSYFSVSRNCLKCEEKIDFSANVCYALFDRNFLISRQDTQRMIHW